MVNRGLVTSRAEASSLVKSGRVLVSGAVAEKAARQVAPGEPVVVAGPPSPFASRGGLKLDAALSFFGIDVGGRPALDAGASTGGFTDCLLQRGARPVVAVDVGHGQMLARLSAHPDVEVRDRTNVRFLTPAALGGRRFAVVVADLSFISLRTVASALVGLAGPGADLVVLVKPQFEVGRQAAARGKGIVRDPELRAEALIGVARAFDEVLAQPVGAMPSPILGAQGNVELCLHLRTGAEPEPMDAAVVEALAAAAREGLRWRT